MKSAAAGVVILVLAVATCLADNQSEQVREVYFETADGGRIVGNLYGNGDHSVVLSHGAVFNKESWDPLAKELSVDGYKVLAIDFRGYGNSLPGREQAALHEDILAAIRYLRRDGARTVSVIGASMGGGAAARAAVEAREGEIDRLILLAPAPIDNPEQMKAGKILFIASKDESLAPRLTEQYERAPEPKRLELLEGTAHAQHIFKTDQSEELTTLIVEFLADDR